MEFPWLFFGGEQDSNPWPMRGGLLAGALSNQRLRLDWEEGQFYERSPQLSKAIRPFDLLVFPFWSIFSRGAKRLTF